MEKLAFKPWERVISDIRLVPKMILLMVFSTVLIVGKEVDPDGWTHKLIS
ncbi:hypothetical protein [Vibrio vulnificus]|nr:hypothetical protein [Vibrio vulnificus]